MALQKTHQKVRKKQKNTRKTYVSECHIGDPLEIRTPDPFIKSEMLCQLS